MAVSRIVPRRLTSKEESDLVRAMRKVERARERLDEAIAERDQLLLDLHEQNVRTGDLADVLGGVSRTTLHKMFERARER